MTTQKLCTPGQSGPHRKGDKMKALAWILLIASALGILGGIVIAFETGVLLTSDAITIAYVVGALILSIDKIRQRRRETK